MIVVCPNCSESALVPCIEPQPPVSLPVSLTSPPRDPDSLGRESTPRPTEGGRTPLSAPPAGFRGRFRLVSVGLAILVLGSLTAASLAVLRHSARGNADAPAALGDSGAQPGQKPVTVLASRAGAKPVALGEAKNAKPADSRTAPAADMDLPPVKPTPVTQDLVAQEFKRARAVYLAARKQASTDLKAQFPRQRDIIEKSNLAALAKNKLLHSLQAEESRFAEGGGLPNDQAMQAAVDDYWHAIQAATRSFAVVVDHALAGSSIA
jgi:hypothetical protein